MIYGLDFEKEYQDEWFKEFLTSHWTNLVTLKHTLEHHAKVNLCIKTIFPKTLSLQNFYNECELINADDETLDKITKFLNSPESLAFESKYINAIKKFKREYEFKCIFKSKIQSIAKESIDFENSSISEVVEFVNRIYRFVNNTYLQYSTLYIHPEMENRKKIKKLINTIDSM